MKQRERDFLIEWNFLFPLDRWWRLKHGVAFLSKEHLEISQLQITYEYLEEKMFEDFLEEGKRRIEIDKEYKAGNWINLNTINSKEEDSLFDNLDIREFNDE